MALTGDLAVPSDRYELDSCGCPGTHVSVEDGMPTTLKGDAGLVYVCPSRQLCGPSDFGILALRLAAPRVHIGPLIDQPTVI